MAASWSWGASAAVGIGILLARGQLAFWAWTVANILAVPVFGLSYRHLPALRPLIDNRTVVFPMVVIQLFAYWMNLQAIYESLTGGVDIETVRLLSPTTGFTVAAMVAVLLSMFIYYRGLPGSLQTDRGQFALQVGACLGIVVTGIALGVPLQSFPATTGSDAGWALWAMLGLLAGPFLDAQHWQRMECADTARPALWAGVWFGGYMLAVYGAGLVLSRGALLPSLLFALVALAIGSSTIDSAAAALQRLTSRRTALGIGVGATLLWPFVRTLGVVNLWTIYASGRVFVVAALLVYVVLKQSDVDVVWPNREIE
jgi:hypothetical protein